MVALQSQGLVGGLEGGAVLGGAWQAVRSQTPAWSLEGFMM